MGKEMIEDSDQGTRTPPYRALDDADRISRERWARLAGFLYLATNATAIYGFAVSGPFISRNDPTQTAANIAASETLFRSAVAAELVTVAGVIALIVALYVVLKPVDRNLALLGAFWRLMENCILAGITFTSLTALALMRGATYLQPMDAQQSHGLMFTLLRVHSYGFQVGFLFLGLGSALFSYLWLKSRYIPRWLALLGMFASLLMAVVALGIVLWPPLFGLVTMAYMAPMAVFEIGLGVWLLVKGIRIPTGE
jgi:hypothetical protein